jgi:hypothetical protein
MVREVGGWVQTSIHHTDNMDPTTTNQLTQVVKKYGAYLYVDEAHSIGALGATGRYVWMQCTTCVCAREMDERNGDGREGEKREKETGKREGRYNGV